MIVKELKDKDQIIKELVDAAPGRSGCFIYPESPMEDQLARSLIYNLERAFSPQYQAMSVLCNIKDGLERVMSRVKSGDSSMLRPKEDNPSSPDTKASQ